MKVANWRVYGLAESIFASGYPMLSDTPSAKEFSDAITQINEDLRIHAEDLKYENPHVKRAIRLANMKDAGHDQFLSGIIFQFDLTFPNKAWVELERYRFISFVSSESSVHRISKMDISKCCNRFVDQAAIDLLAAKQKAYNECPADNEALKRFLYLDMLFNIPSGFELTARLTTNYRCLKNLYAQRCNHPVPDWREFCAWIRDTLPLAPSMICGDADGGSAH